MTRSPSSSAFRKSSRRGFENSCPKIILKPTSVKGLMNLAITHYLCNLAANIRTFCETAKYLATFLRCGSSDYSNIVRQPLSGGRLANWMMGGMALSGYAPLFCCEKSWPIFASIYVGSTARTLTNVIKWIPVFIIAVKVLA